MISAKSRMPTISGDDRRLGDDDPVDVEQDRRRDEQDAEGDEKIRSPSGAGS